MKLNSIPILIIVIFLLSCGKNESNKNYFPVLKELHKIECEHINKAVIKFKYQSAYEFRSVAFQEVLKNTDRALLAHYEDLYAELARQEFLMNDNEKKIFYNDLENVYKNECK